MPNGNWYASQGLLNVEAPDLSDLAGKPNLDKRGTFCSGACASRSYFGRGILVSAGDRYLDRCPICNSVQVFHDRVTKGQVDHMRRRQAVAA